MQTVQTVKERDETRRCMIVCVVILFFFVLLTEYVDRNPDVKRKVNTTISSVEKFFDRKSYLFRLY